MPTKAQIDAAAKAVKEELADYPDARHWYRAQALRSACHIQEDVIYLIGRISEGSMSSHYARAILIYAQEIVTRLAQLDAIDELAGIVAATGDAEAPGGKAE
jgi:hypothetical protein